MSLEPYKPKIEELNFDKKQTRKSKVFNDVRITPGEFVFFNKNFEEIQIKKLTIQNISPKNANVTIFHPANPHLYFNDAKEIERERYTLFPGLVISKYLTYSTQKYEISSEIIVNIDGLELLIPIKTKTCRANVIIYPESIDFGILNIGGAFADRTLTLYNSGCAATKFSIIVGTNPIQVEPKHGFLKPSQKIQIRLRAAGVKIGQHTASIWVECSSSVAKFVNISLISVVPNIVIHHPVKKGNITMLNFSAVYYGTCSYESFIVRNYSAERNIFILTVEQNKQRQVYMEVEDDKVKKWLHIWPFQCTMEPFESMVFSICFRPCKLTPKKGWKHQNPYSDDFMWAYLKVEEVAQIPFKKTTNTEVRESTTKKRGSLKIQSLMKPENEDLAICIHGKAEQADITFEPECITMCAAVGDQDRSTVKLTNPSHRLPIHFEFIKTPYVITRPVFGIIPPTKSIEILLIFRAKSLGSLNCKLYFNIKSYCNLTDQEEMITLKKKAIALQLFANSVTKQPVSQFNLGITPRVAHEVGVHTDNVKFNSDLRKVPAAAMVSLDPDLKTQFWFRDNSYTVAFPNDMSLKLYERPHDETKRTIFKGTPRYLPPANPNEALSDFEIFLINERRKMAREFIRSFGEGKIGEERQLCIKSKSLSSERLHGLLTLPSPSLPQIKPIIKTNPSKQNVVSLTPIQLFNISITPINFNFGLIPVGIECSMTITFHNENPFPITFIFMYEEKLVFPKKILIGPMTKLSQQMSIKLKNTGKYISSFVYILCDIHKYFKTVRAEAVQSFLKMVPTIVEFPPPKYNDIFQPCYIPIKLINPFSSPTKFEWQCTHRHVVEIVPDKGVIRDNDTIMCLVYAHKFFRTRKKVVISLSAGDAAINSLTCFIPAFTDYKVTPISPVVNIKTVAAGIKVTKPLYLFNYGNHKTSYYVRGSFPIDGIEVHPKCGIIPPKSLETLDVTLRIECLMILNFDIIIDIEGIMTKKIQLIGNISFPTVEFQPNRLNFLTTKCYSFSSQAVKIINKSNEDVILNIRLKHYCQFKITFTPLHYDPDVGVEDIILKSNSSKTMYVHFKPEHIAAYDFYLPICINNFLGPPEINKDSNRVSTFMNFPAEMNVNKKKSTKPYILSSHFNVMLKPPEFFDAVWVTCVVRPADIVFSTLHVDIDSVHLEQAITKKITISNPKDESVTIQFGNITLPFTLRPLKDVPSPYLIAGKDKLDLIVTFKPYKTGSWSEAVPVSIVRGTTITHYNDLVLSGMCHPSSLYCTTTELYLIPVPLGTRIDKKIMIFASHQRQDTDLKMLTFCKSNIERKIGVEFPESPHIPKNTDGVLVPITISFLSSDVVSFQVKFIFRDGMEGELEICMFATATDSLIPNHWFYFSNQSTEEELDDARSRVGVFRSGSVGSRESAPRRFVGAVGWRDSEMTEVVNLGKQRYSSASMLLLPCTMKSELSSGNFSEEDHLFYWSKIYTYVSRWLLYSVFCGSYQPKLEDITWSKGFMEQCQLQPSTATTKTFIDLIIALFGSEILAKTNLSCESPGLDDFVRINYCLKAYTKMLAQMDVYGVGLCHISPLYLLNYNDYCTLYDWNENKVPGVPSIEFTSTKKSKKDFESFSKKMWLEFYLQLFKSHTLDMCVGLAVVDDWPKTHRGTIQSTMTLSEYHSIAFDKMSPISKIITGDMLDQVNQDRSHSEAVLVAWISRTYRKVRGENIIELPPLDEDKVMDLGMSLRNGVILAGVTAYYCPFLVSILTHIKREPITDEEICHNANHLIVAWDEVKLGIMVKSEDIVECNPIFMMMLVAYLYLSLPTFLPAYVLRAAVPLADAGTTVLSLNNQSNFELRYYVKLYQDPHEPFSVAGSKPYYKVKPKGTVHITIHFVSNRIGKVTGLLVLCGANGPDIHGMNMCVKLEGEPTLTKISNKITVKLPMYQQVFFYQKIFSPYDKGANYNLEISIAKPSLDMRQVQEWNTRKKCVFPQMVVPGCNFITVPAYPDHGVVQLACCCFTTTKAVRWITFSSATAGDFVCKIILQPQEERNPGSYTIEYPLSSFLSEEKEEAFIPIELKIPCANLSLVKTSLQMLSLMVRYDELYFYNKYWGRYIGLKLFEQELLTLCPNIIQIRNWNSFLQSNITYDITCDSPLIDVQKQITIPDVHTEEYTILPIRLKTCVDEAFTAKLKLMWTQGGEQRLYKLNFVPISKSNWLIKVMNKTSL